MLRFTLTASLVLVLFVASFARAQAPRGAQKTGDDPKPATDPTDDYEDQLKHLRAQEAEHLKKVDEGYREAIRLAERPEERERLERARLEGEKKEALKGIDDRYDHILRNLEPKKAQQQMGEALKSLDNLHSALSVGEYDYGGNRRDAQEAIAKARLQIKRAIARDDPAEFAKAARDLQTAHRDVGKALAYSDEHLAAGDYPRDGNLARQLAANRKLAETLPFINKTGHLLSALDHPIKDYDREKRELLKRQDELKKKVGEHFETKIEQKTKEIRTQKVDVKQLERQKEEAQKQIKERYSGKIKQVEEKVKQGKGRKPK